MAEKLRQTRGRPPLDAEAVARILESTTDVFLERGYARASTNAIARRARTSKQTLYGLFPTKADLFVGAMETQTEQLFARHGEYLQSSDPPREAMFQMGREMLRLFASPRFAALYRMVVGEALAFPDLARKLWLSCADRGYGLLAEYLESRGLGEPAYRKAAGVFISLVLGDFILNAMLNPDFTLSDEEIDTRVRDAVDGFMKLYPVRDSSK